MTLVESIRDEVTQFVIILIGVIVVCGAWWSTNISDQRPFRTLLLLDRRRPVFRLRRRLTNHTEAVTISEGTPSSSSHSESEIPAEGGSAETSSQSSSITNKPTVIVTSSTSSSSEADIIETMDADPQAELRQRRIAHFQSTDDVNEENPSDNITIKLKYINDDIKVVDGRLEELLGSFKRRHFEEEFNNNKEIKLIFNGQVLKQDQNSLQSCGLFDNCVVHCLIVPKRSSVTESNPQPTPEQNAAGTFLRNNPFSFHGNNNNQVIDWDLGNFLFAVVSFILMTAWYFRYIYAHLYTVTATVGLIIVTGVFTIVLVGSYLPNDDYERSESNLRIRVARLDRNDTPPQQQLISQQ